MRNFAELHNRSELMRMADDYILEHFVDVAEAEDFLKISAQMLQTFIESENLNVDDECQVYEGRKLSYKD